MRYPVVLYPDKILKQQTRPVVEITDEMIQLLDDLYETMLAHDGIGIAAPQIGKNLRIAIVALGDEEEGEEEEIFELINPQIIQKKGSSVDVEGCLSLPKVYGTVERAEEVTVRYINREGHEMEVDAYGYLARAFQHEIDHLNGEVFVDKIIERIAPEELDAFMEEHIDD